MDILGEVFREWRVLSWCAQVRAALEEIAEGPSPPSHVGLCILCVRQAGRVEWERYLHPSETLALAMLSDTDPFSDSD